MASCKRLICGLSSGSGITVGEKETTSEMVRPGGGMKMLDVRVTAISILGAAFAFCFGCVPELHAGRFRAAEDALALNAKPFSFNILSRSL